jgi:ssRNA-specific RNase YbeY (16S rRNA maturation enzyme)
VLHLSGHDHHRAVERRAMRALERRALAEARGRLSTLARALSR